MKNNEDKEMKVQITDLIEQLSTGLYERKEIVAQSLLAILAKQSVFLYGPPGTAKSLIARRVSAAFEGSQYFEILMNRFTTPEEVFGPISLKELKEDRYLRKVEGFLPAADVAFLDEIWKSSPAILNTLLTIVNERKFRNDGKVNNVPLKGIIAASNEVPPPGQGLDALYDRLVMRLGVMPVEDTENSFKNLIDPEPGVGGNVEIDKRLRVTNEVWKDLLEKSDRVRLSDEAWTIIKAIRVKIEKYNHEHEKTPLYVSDRRWKMMVALLKMAATLVGRDHVKPIDLMILCDCLWTIPETRAEIAELVVQAVKEYSPYKLEAYETWKKDFNALQKDVEDTLYYTANEYETAKTINGVDCVAGAVGIARDYYCRSDMLGLLLPKKYIGTNDSFHPYDTNGQKLHGVNCNFNGGKTCSVSGRHDSCSIDGGAKISVSPKHEKGNCKSVVPRVKNSFIKEVKDRKNELETNIKQIENFYEEERKLNDTPFVSEEKKRLVTVAIEDYLETVRSSRHDVNQLEKQINEHVDA